jgi:hypothetical protein
MRAKGGGGWRTVTATSTIIKPPQMKKKLWVTTSTLNAISSRAAQPVYQALSTGAKLRLEISGYAST